MAVNFNNYFVAAPNLRVLCNMGCLFDIPTGKWVKGKHGESIMNGGLSYFTGVAGRGNMFKSVLLHFMMLRILQRLRKSYAMVHDSEASVQFSRFQQLAQNLEWLNEFELEETGRLFLTDNTVMSGNEWFKGLRKFVEDKVKAKKEWLVTTPFLDEKSGKLVQIMYPTVSELDSISQLQTDSVEEIYVKNDIGSGAANTDSLRSSAAKSQMLMQIPTLTGKGEVRSLMSAHMGDDIPLDPYAPNVKKLGFLKGKDKLKHTPEKFTFLTNNLWQVLSASVMATKDKTPQYPKDSNDDLEGDTDLQILTIRNLRAKSGPTGMLIQILVSQREGVLIPLSELHYCKSNDNYGIGGHDRAYYFELLPEVVMQRTTARRKLYEDPRMQRVSQITSEMCQMEQLWNPDRNLHCTPKQLYEDLKAKGYDWERLYNTRGYWTFEEEKDEHLPFLSTMDLLNMRAGTYHPYWYGDLPK